MLACLACCSGVGTNPVSAIAQRRKNPLAQIRVERLSADRLDDAADPVDVDAVLPSLAGVEVERPAQCRHLARYDPGRAGGLDVAQRVRVPEFIGKAGRVGQQVPEGDRPLGGAQQRRATGAEAFEHLRRGQRGFADVRHRCVEAEPALLDELHRPNAGDRLCHREDAEDRVERHWRPAAELAHAERPLVDRPLVARRHRDDPRHLASRDRTAQHLIDLFPCLRPCHRAIL
jgi:hypothetical protein